MTRTALILAAALSLGTAATADQSDRYNDLRFNTAVGHIDYTSDAVGTQRAEQTTVATSGTRQSAPQGSYAYANRFGVGPNNDSR
ncbi:MAG: hypothetical protein AAGM84_14515 [Pseudomonadota bacterium]